MSDYFIWQDGCFGFELEKKFSFEEFLCKYYRELQIQTKIFESYFIDIGIPEDYEKFIESMQRYSAN